MGTESLSSDVVPSAAAASSAASTTTTALSALPSSTPDVDVDLFARGLGYVIGAGSLALYTPIAIRLYRQKTADGLTLSTWWLKIVSYTCSDLYAYTNGYPISTYVETLIITIEAAVILFLTANYQKKLDSKFVYLLSAYVLITTWGILGFAPTSLIALGQGASAVLNTGALIPQFVLNYQKKSSGDYSPLTASLASIGCFIRIFTTIQLADSDPILLGTFGMAFIVNTSLAAQILYYGIVSEKRDLKTLLTADFSSSSASEYDDDDELEEEALIEKEQELMITSKNT